MRRIFYIYDQVADNYIYFMDAAADAVAIRSFKYACEHDFKAVAPDLSLWCLGELKDGMIIPDHTQIYREDKDA